MSCPRRRQCGGSSNSWSYSWSTRNGVTTYKTSGNVPQGYLKTQAPTVTKTVIPASSSETKAVSSKSGGKNDLSDYHDYGLYLHNWYRKRHGSPKMATSARLNQAADAYAYKLACRKQLVHTSGLDYNENLYMSWGSSASKKEHVRKACESWYNEKKLYNFNSPGFSMQTGHFTAMVWKGCTQLGIGVGEANGTVCVVACYKPVANMMGQFGRNVLPWRTVVDTDDEEEEEAKKAEAAKAKEAAVAKAKEAAAAKAKEEEATKAKAKEAATSQSKSTEDSSGSEASDESDDDDDDDAITDEAKEAFKSKASSLTGTIGWSDLRDILNESIKVEFKFDGFDKTICSLLISMMTLRKGEKQEIGVEEFGDILNCIEGFLDAYSEFDADNSGLLDPFELKAALQEAGFDISFKTFQTLQTVFADEEGNIDFKGYVLCFVLLSKLQVVQETKKSGTIEDFSLKGWLEGEIKSSSN